MTIKRFTSSVLTLATVLMLNTFGLVGHASAMPVMAHDMGGMDHSKGAPNPDCVTLCTRTVVKAEGREQMTIREDQKQEPFIPFYLQYQSSSPPTELKSSFYGLAIRPPPKVPIYILHSVSRR